MQKDLYLILDPILAIDIETEVSNLIVSYKTIEALCLESKTPSTRGSLRNAMNHLTIYVDVTRDLNEWIKVKVPSLIVVELVAGAINGREVMILDFMIGYTNGQNRLNEVKRLRSEAAGKISSSLHTQHPTILH